MEPFSIFVWALQTGKLLDVLAGHAGPVSALSADEQWALSKRQLGQDRQSLGYLQERVRKPFRTLPRSFASHSDPTAKLVAGTLHGQVGEQMIKKISR